MALATVTEGAARSTVLKVTQVEPSHGFVAWQAPVGGDAAKSSNDSAATHVQGREGIERKAHSMVIEDGLGRASIQSDR